MTNIIMAEAPIAIGYDKVNVLRTADGTTMQVEKTMLVALTPCCAASGKGGGNGVVCRKCYRDVNFEYGCFWYTDGSPEMWEGMDLASGWHVYTNLLVMDGGVSQEKAEALTEEAKRQAQLVS